MKRIYYFALFAIAFAISSCQADGPNDLPTPSAEQLSIVTSVAQSESGWGELTAPSAQFKVGAVATRINVTDNVFEAGDRIGLYIVEWMGRDAATQVKAPLESSGNLADNHRYTYQTVPSATWLAPALPNPLTWRKVSVYAYYPYSTPISDALAFPFTVREDQRSGVNSQEYLMWAEGAANNAGYSPTTDPTPIALRFKHLTAHITVKVVLPAIYNGTTISTIDAAQVLDVPVTGNKLNLETGVLTRSVNVADIKPVQMQKKAGGNILEGEFYAVVTPFSIAAGHEVIKIDYTGSPASGSLYLYAGSAGFNFLANHRYTLTLSTEEFGFASDLPEFSGDVMTDTHDVKVVSTDPALAWGMVSGDKTWVELSLDRVNWGETIASTEKGTKSIPIKIHKNTTGQSRMTKVTLRAAGHTDVELVVFQKANTI